MYSIRILNMRRKKEEYAKKKRLINIRANRLIEIGAKYGDL